MSQSQQPNWPQAGQNPFADRPDQPLNAEVLLPGQFGPPPTPLEDMPAMRWVLPVGTSGWAIAAGYLGLFSLICFPAPFAVFCSLMAIRDLRRNPKLSGWGRAIFGLVLGTLGSGFLLFGIIAAVAGK